MNRQTLENAGINYQEGVERFRGKSALYESLLAGLPQDNTFDALDKAMENRQYSDAFQAAHALKGLLGNLSVNALLEQLRPLVDALREGNAVLARQLYPRVKESYSRTINLIRGEEHE